MDDLLDRIGHWYLASYMLCSSFQWMYLLKVYKRLLDHTMGCRIKEFQTAKIIPDRAEQILTEHFEEFARRYKVFLANQIISSSIYVGTIIMGFVQTLLTTGRMDLDKPGVPNFPNVPPQIRVAVLLMNILATASSMLVITSTFIITGIQTLNIQVLSEIINEALEQADGSAVLKSCVRDHNRLINMAKEARNICRYLNNPLFMVIYLLLAAQLLYLNAAEDKGAITLTLICDASSCLMLLVSQCWFASNQTISLESVAAGAYASPWCDRKKCYADTILMMIRMAQQYRPQKVWLGSLTIERATILKIMQRSYSFYTVLMIMQSKQRNQCA